MMSEMLVSFKNPEEILNFVNTVQSIHMIWI